MKYHGLVRLWWLYEPHLHSKSHVLLGHVQADRKTPINRLFPLIAVGLYLSDAIHLTGYAKYPSPDFHLLEPVLQNTCQFSLVKKSVLLLTLKPLPLFPLDVFDWFFHPCCHKRLAQAWKTPIAGKSDMKTWVPKMDYTYFDHSGSGSSCTYYVWAGTAWHVVAPIDWKEQISVKDFQRMFLTYWFPQLLDLPLQHQYQPGIL